VRPLDGKFAVERRNNDELECGPLAISSELWERYIGRRSEELGSSGRWA
jgi:hypothetical protein